MQYEIAHVIYLLRFVPPFLLDIPLKVKPTSPLPPRRARQILKNDQNIFAQAELNK